MYVRVPHLLFIASFSLLAGACTTAETTEEVASDDGELRALDPSEIVGALSYGQTSDPVTYTKTPTYRAFSFTGSKGDEVEAWIRSGDGDARGWILAGAGA